MIAISFPCLLLLISVTLASCAGQNGMSSVLPDPKQISTVKPLSSEVEHYTSDDKKESKGNIILHVSIIEHSYSHLYRTVFITALFC
jgi:hypothetical protein